MICIKCRDWFPDEDGDFCPICKPKSKDPAPEREKDGKKTDRQEEILEYTWLRYGRGSDVEGRSLGHFTDCSIETREICTCGLLHDLGILPAEMAMEVYARFMSELKAQLQAFDRMEKY